MSSYLIHFPFEYVFVFLSWSLHPVLTGPIRQISLNRSLPLSPPKIALHPSISALPASFPHFISSVSSPLICLQILPTLAVSEPPTPTTPDLLHISLMSFLASPIPRLSFPPANCWNVLAIFGVLLPSSPSSCHICHERELKIMSFHCSLAHA